MAPTGSSKSPWAPLVLRPTVEDVMSINFGDYIAKHELRILKAGGVCKIVMPAPLKPRREGYKGLGQLVIKRAIRQHAVGARGLFRCVYVEQKPMTLTEFSAIAMDKDNLPSVGPGGEEARSGSGTDAGHLERKFWKNVTIRAPLYGADVEGSLFDPAFQGWNLRHLDTLLSRVLEESGHKLPGVNTPYLYFGQWRSMFAWHTEDLDLYSVNYLHFGAPKQWYVIPPEYRARFEAVARAQVPEMHKACPEFLRHKELMVSPQFLDTVNIPYIRLVQREREFVITYPGVYHAGFNHGLNCAESVNFATRRWIPIGARAGVCRCSSDAVQIDMRLFRHLVPASQLPEELFEDTTDEEEGDKEGRSDEASSSGSDSDDSSTEGLRAARKRTRAESRTSHRSPTPPPKRARGASGAPTARRMRLRKPAALHADKHVARPAKPLIRPRRAAPGAMVTRGAAAAASGRLSVHERIALRGSAAAAPAKPSARLPTPRMAAVAAGPAHTGGLTAARKTLPSEEPAAMPAQRTLTHASASVGQGTSDDSRTTQAGLAGLQPGGGPAPEAGPSGRKAAAGGVGVDAASEPPSTPRTRGAHMTTAGPAAGVAMKAVEGGDRASRNPTGGGGGGGLLSALRTGALRAAGAVATVAATLQGSPAGQGPVAAGKDASRAAAPSHSTRGRLVRKPWKLLSQDE